MDGKTTLTFPTIHLNGTSAESLKQQVYDVLAAINQLKVALANASPNARDYYVQNDNAFPKACSEHVARSKKLDELCNEYVAILENLSEQEDARRR